tara:strand:- start:169 stop:534 length:366 start_codon:yes stop_codon:yes gene_type:complete
MDTKTFDPNKDLITITEGAKSHFKKTVQDANAIGVRLSLTGGGCAGFSYQWDLVNDISDIKLQEYNLKFEDWQFWLDTISKEYLVGSIVDLKTGVAGSYIDIESPLASSKCGCGESVTFTI